MFLLFLALVSLVVSQNPDCKRKCDERFGHLPKQTFCNNFKQTVSIPFDNVSEFCYLACNITALYPGKSIILTKRNM